MRKGFFLVWIGYHLFSPPSLGKSRRRCRSLTPCRPPSPLHLPCIQKRVVGAFRLTPPPAPPLLPLITRVGCGDPHPASTTTYSHLSRANTSRHYTSSPYSAHLPCYKFKREPEMVHCLSLLLQGIFIIFLCNFRLCITSLAHMQDGGGVLSYHYHLPTSLAANTTLR